MGAPRPRRRGRPSPGDPALDDATLLDAALDAFAEHGYAGTSVRDLGRRLGVSHNLIPQRFGSKERLWYAAVDHGFGALTSALVDDFAPPEDDLERLRAMVVRFVERNAARPALLRIINQEAVTAGPRLDYLFERYIAPVAELGGRVLGDLRGAGRVRTDSVALVYFFMIHGAAGPAALPALAERFGATFEVADAVEVLFDGLRADN